MEAVLLKLGLTVLGLFGGAHALENLLENYVMDHVPTKFKALVVPVISVIFAVVAAVQGGTDPWAAAMLAAGFTGYVNKVHNSPDLTSADWPAIPLEVEDLTAGGTQ